MEPGLVAAGAALLVLFALLLIALARNDRNGLRRSSAEGAPRAILSLQYPESSGDARRLRCVLTARELLVSAEPPA